MLFNDIYMGIIVMSSSQLPDMQDLVYTFSASIAMTLSFAPWDTIDAMCETDH